MHATSHAPHLFLDRRSAGLELAEALMPHVAERPLVLALPRGGVPVAFEVARTLRAELDILLVRRIGAPGHSGLALGAVIDGANPQFVVNEELMRQVRPPSGWFEEEVQRQLQELERARRLYCSEPPPPVAGRCVILVDDGIDTGSSVRAALKGLAKSAPGQLILAVPVAPREVVKDLQPLVDELVCLAMPEPFGAIWRHYGDFGETSDQEVVDLLAEARHSAR
ncbi:MAG: phosphoribosyltransferase [Pseudomonadales bacterium GWC1_66_9]|uniref:Phosphoribosyltransferase n=1 Tax=Azotobacter chroococcum NCIMB 8003 TaxID=1328314 RepID=A0A0C4WRR6_9GAMM|nr:phosphoribosyltransferase family protein [Azotobacter chroococcum]AJE20997.1 Phosphoribosyltransferase [Azotobacter chroococcum NCIMB 8003]OHC12201.1 MAG: phosphoribosyltransferase [Pseudomonadales bacterium GWC1_66_9]